MAPAASTCRGRHTGMTKTMEGHVPAFPWGRPEERNRVSSHATYVEATRTVEALRERGVPAKALSIAAHDVRELRSVVPARSGERRRWVVFGMALGGLGLSLALAPFGFANYVDTAPAGPAVAVVALAIAGMVAGVVAASLADRLTTRRSELRATSLVAGYFDVLIDPVARRAEEPAAEREDRSCFADGRP